MTERLCDVILVVSSCLQHVQQIKWKLAQHWNGKISRPKRTFFGRIVIKWTDLFQLEGPYILYGWCVTTKLDVTWQEAPFHPAKDFDRRQDFFLVSLWWIGTSIGCYAVRTVCHGTTKISIGTYSRVCHHAWFQANKPSLPFLMLDRQNKTREPEWAPRVASLSHAEWVDLSIDSGHASGAKRVGVSKVFLPCSKIWLKNICRKLC